ncbi:MAG: Holliday junction resolvase RuvX [Flavobacteriales bacterium]|nr:Holliday junction resolvase RuvX [Flavobacteriales bacterium]
MSKLLAIDYGKKRCGIAVTDDDQIIASGLTTIPAKEIMKFLEDYLKNNAVECFVLGEPKRLNGMETHSTEAVMKFKTQLEGRFKLPVHMIDERFTSKMAFQTMIDSGLKKKARRNKDLIDEISATLILQSFMTSR